MNTVSRGHWSNHLAFILAATGSAVGLGNIWKFPYMTGENGGGAFVIVYLVCIVLVGIPLMVAEIMVGRRGNSSPSMSFRNLATEAGASPAWSLVGSLGVLTSFIILTFYSVIGGWSLAYLLAAVQDAFSGGTKETIGSIFSQLLASPGTMTIWHTVFMGLVIFVVSRGITHGIERAITILMPAMFVILLILLGYAVTSGGFGASLQFIFVPHFDQLTTSSVLSALGHAFFTLSLGMSVMVAYGSHLPGHIGLTRAAVTVSLLDTVVALMAGVAIFSIVFANDMSPESGPGLVFLTLPLAFGHMTGGYLVSIFFFFMLVFAAWSSAISLAEPVVEGLESHFKTQRRSASVLVGVVAWSIGILSVLSFNILSGFKPFFDMGIFDLLDGLTTNIMLPIAGIMVAIFCGWIVKDKVSFEEIGGSPRVHRCWLFLLRYITPVLVAIVFVYKLI